MNRKKLINLFSILHLFVLSTLTFFGFNHYFNISSTNYVLFFLIFLIAINVFWLFNLIFFSPKVKVLFLIVHFFSFIGVFLIEGFLNFYLIVKTDREFNDNRTIREVVDEDNSNGNISVPVFYPNSFDSQSLLNLDVSITPLSGQSNIRTFYCNESGKYAKYDSDRYGFNNPNYEWDNETDFLVLGDSFTHGSCVDKDKNIPSRLRNLTNKSVLNLGFSGNGPLREYATFIEYGSTRQSKIVLWLFFEGNDYSDLIVEKRNKVLTKYMKFGFSQNLIINQPKIDSLIEEINLKSADENKTKKGLLEFFQLYKIRSALHTFDFLFKEEIDSMFLEIIKRVKEKILLNNGELYFVYLPEHGRYANYFNNPFFHDNYKSKKLTLTSIKSLGIETIDIHDRVFTNLDDINAIFPKGGHHYTENAYELVAQEILRFINTQK